MALIFREAKDGFRDKVKEMECRDGRRKKERPESISDEDAVKKRLDVGELGAALRSLISRADEDNAGCGARWPGQRLSIERPARSGSNGETRGEAGEASGSIGRWWLGTRAAERWLGIKGRRWLVGRGKQGEDGSREGEGR